MDLWLLVTKSSMVLNVKALNGVCIKYACIQYFSLHIKVIYFFYYTVSQIFIKKFFINFRNVTVQTQNHFPWLFPFNIDRYLIYSAIHLRLSIFRTDLHELWSRVAVVKFVYIDFLELMNMKDLNANTGDEMTTFSWKKIISFYPYRCHRRMNVWTCNTNNSNFFEV